MNYEFWFWILIAFFLGRYTKCSEDESLIYVGTDKEKYSKAKIGILLRE